MSDLNPYTTDRTENLIQWPHLTSFLTAVLCVSFFVTYAIAQRNDAFMLRGVTTAVDPPNPAQQRLGVNVALEQYSLEEIGQTLSEIDQLPFTQIKQSFYFGEDKQWETADQIFQAAQNYPGLEVVPLLDGSPTNNFAPPDDVNQFAQWTAEFATRYGDQVQYYIIWDEPNLSEHFGNRPANPQSYASLLSAASIAIRAVDADAIIVAAPLAPTTETSGSNMAADLYMRRLIEDGAAEAFDIAAAKPYGFSHSPYDRRTERETLNFSHVILLRETLVELGYADTPIWAGNWGWNSLPDDWSGQPSIWGEENLSAQAQINYIIEGYTRAQHEWGWMGSMFLHHWEPIAAQQNDPHIGFAIRGHPHLDQLIELESNPNTASTGFHFASPNEPSQNFIGDWKFSPQFGADMSEKADNEHPDSVTFTFEGTEAGLRVRRANYRARFYVLIDGQPANALPPDETTNTPNGRGSALVLNTNTPEEDFIETQLVATGLKPGTHTMTVTAFRGWDQWALNGFTAAYQPIDTSRNQIWLQLSIIMGALTFVFVYIANWHPLFSRFPFATQITNTTHALITAAAALIVTISGWMSWGAQAAGVFRRLDDQAQLALVAGTAAVFYITPWVYVYAGALLILFGLIYSRPPLGLALIALSIPFYVAQTLKPIYVYRFSAVEIFTLITFLAISIQILIASARQWAENRRLHPPMLAHVQWKSVDGAVLALTLLAIISLPFTDRLDVATNELRTVIIEPALLYAMLRIWPISEREMRWVLGGYIAGGVAVAMIGLTQYITGTNLITAEAGLMRHRSIYGSPNNVALYLGRMVPILLAIFLIRPTPSPARTTLHAILMLFKKSRPIHWIALAGSIVMLVAILLSFSKGGLLLGIPAMLIALFLAWQKQGKRKAWPWIVGGLAAALIIYPLILQLPQLAGRLDWRSATTDFRINLWKSSLIMWREHWIIGVGLDNFLYAYRSRYILAAGWQEANLNHPHNWILDFATRLGSLGLLVGIWLFGSLATKVYQNLQATNTYAGIWPAVIVGTMGSFVYMMAHGLVDHSFFLIDLAYSTYFLGALIIWIQNRPLA